jgi:peptide chain release factor 1
MLNEKLEAILARHEELNGRLADPAVLADPAEYQRLAKLHAEIAPVVEEYRRLLKVRADRAQALALLAETTDAELRELAEADAKSLGAREEEL